MDYYKNVDHFPCSTKISRRLRGINYKFVSEDDYVEPVSVGDFKQYAYIDFATDDTLVPELLKSTRIQAEQYLRKSLGVRTVLFTALECPDETKMMWGPVADGQDGFFGDILLEGGFKVSKEFVTDASLVNEDIKVAIMAQALYVYQNRDRFRERLGFHDTFKEKLNPYRNLIWP